MDGSQTKDAGAPGSKEEVVSENSDFAVSTRRHWLGQLPHQEADKIIKPEFDKAHEGLAAKRSAAKKYTEATGHSPG